MSTPPVAEERRAAAPAPQREAPPAASLGAEDEPLPKSRAMRRMESAGEFTPPAAPPPKAPMAVQAPAGAVKAHLASYYTAAEAEHAWRLLTTQNAMLADYAHVVEVVDLGAKGKMWRLYLVGDLGRVDDACRALKERRQYCVVY